MGIVHPVRMAAQTLRVVCGACGCSLLSPLAVCAVDASAQAKPTAGKAALGVGAAVLGVGAAALLVFQEVETVLQASSLSLPRALISDNVNFPCIAPSAHGTLSDLPVQPNRSLSYNI